jgi:purine-binding chemotaxis protein CheW
MSQEPPPTPWQILLQRLAKLSGALDQTESEVAARGRAVLDARAKEMAAAAERDRSVEPTLELVTFRLGRQRCGIPTSFVFEVLPLPPCTLLPGVPPHFLGMCSLRGQILLVADLAQLFAFAQAEAAAESQLLILGGERPEIGVLALGECQTMVLPLTALSSARELTGLPVGSCARGITTEGLLVLDGQSLLSDPRLYINQAGEERPS